MIVAAVLTAIFCLAVWGSVLRKMPGAVSPRVLLIAFVVALPLQPLAFYGVRMPFHHWLIGVLGHLPPLWVGLLYAPVTEELAKLVPLLIPAVRRAVHPSTCARIALAIGLGFGLGEIGLLAHLTDTKLPFYVLGGFLGERFMVCLLHAAFVAMSLRWRGGLGLAMLAHLGLNLPIALKFGPIFLSLWTAAYFVGAIYLLASLSLGRWEPGELLLGRARCPGCQKVYPRPLLLGCNLGPKRYERCPHCRKWHFTSMADSVPVEIEHPAGGEESQGGHAPDGG